MTPQYHVKSSTPAPYKKTAARHERYDPQATRTTQLPDFYGKSTKITRYDTIASYRISYLPGMLPARQKPKIEGDGTHLLSPHPFPAGPKNGYIVFRQTPEKTDLDCRFCAHKMGHWQLLTTTRGSGARRLRRAVPELDRAAPRKVRGQKGARK